MANKKATASSTKKKSAASSTKNKTVVSVKTAAKTKASAASTRPRALNALPENIMQITLAEFVGTFLLTAVALTATVFSGLSPILVGLGLVMIVLAVYTVSGAQLNPAITFGLWAAGKLRPILIPFYWGAQFLGAIAAFLLLTVFGTSSSLGFGSIFQMNPTIFLLELVGMAIFMFGVTAVVSQEKLNLLGKAFGIGLSLLTAIVVTMSMIVTNNNTLSQKIVTSGQVTEGADTSKMVVVSGINDIPRVLQVSSASLNPAIALVSTENSKSEVATQYGISSDTNTTSTTKDSHFTLETLFGALIGAAIGSNIYRLLTLGRKN